MLKGRLGFASPTEVDAVVSTKVVQRVHKGALCSVRHITVEGAAHLLGAPKVLKEARHCARHMVGENAASLMVVVFVQKVYMEALTSVLPMVVERGVLCQAALRVLVAGLTVVLDMVEESGANLKIVRRVLRGAQISTRLMVGKSVAADDG